MQGKKEIMVYIIIAIMVGLYVSPLFLNIDKSFTLFPKNIPNGWYCSMGGERLFKEAVLKFHSFPLWLPGFEGGEFWMKYPISVPLFPLAFELIFGEIAGVKINWIVFFLAGACSMYYLSRNVLKYSIFGSVFAALTFSMSGAFAYLFENGFIYCREVLLLPLLLAFFIKTKQSFKYVVLCGFVFSIMLIQTALFFPMIVLFLFLFSVLKSAGMQNKKLYLDFHWLKVFLAICALSILFSAFRLLPLVNTLLENNRSRSLLYSTSFYNVNTPGLFFKRLLIPENFGPGTMYLGYLPVILCLFSAIFYFRSLKKIFAILFLFIALSFGSNFPVDIHRFLSRLPIFGMMVEISKYYSVIIVFMIAVLSGRLFSFFEFKRNKVLTVAVPVVAILILYFNLLNANIGYFNVFNDKLSKTVKENQFFQVRGLNIHSGDESILNPMFYFFSRNNTGLMTFNDFLFKKESTVIPKYFLLPKYAFLAPYTSLLVLPNPEYKGEAFFLNDINEVKKVQFSANAISVQAYLKLPDRLVVNQNFDKYWKSDQGMVEDYNGLISLRLKTGGGVLVHFSYFPKTFYLGLLISLLSVFLSGYVLFKPDFLGKPAQTKGSGAF